MGEKKDWTQTLSETVDKITKAANEAWDGTADLRKDAWEKTKTAANTASEAIDEGVAQAKRSFQGSDELEQQDPQEPEDVRGEEREEDEGSAETDAT